MTHNFQNQPSGEHAERFSSWLEEETIDTLRRSVGDGEAVKSAIFLFVNRAYEARMPEDDIGALFGRCLVRAGFCEADIEPALDLLELFAQLAEGAYLGTDESG